MSENRGQGPCSSGGHRGRGRVGRGQERQADGGSRATVVGQQGEGGQWCGRRASQLRGPWIPMLAGQPTVPAQELGTR